MNRPARRPRSRSRDYVPLVTSAVVLLALLTALPSALNLPQANPGETLEYAPVPPEGDEPPPPVGNLSSLGLATGRGVGTGTGEGGEGIGGAGDGGPVGVGKNPSTKRCIGKPPRQTEDRLSPPCVAHFSGNNFGSTYQGVTKDEIRVLFYLEGGVTWFSQRERAGEPAPSNTYFDLWEPAGENEHILVHTLRAYQRHFNERYQTYERRAHFFVYFSATRQSSPEARKADAAANFHQVKPFAVITYVLTTGDEVFYVEEMARRGVLNFGTFAGRSASFYNGFPRLIWGYEPSLEQHARSFVNYVCRKVVPHPASFSGNPGENGRPRRLGILMSTDPNYPALERMNELVYEGVQRCGGVWEAEADYRYAGHYSATNEDDAPGNMARFRQAGVTTIIWPGGMEVGHSHAAGATGYLPEWVIAGDRTIEASNAAQYQNQASFLDRAWVVSTVVQMPRLHERACYQAYREADTETPDGDVDVYGCRPYFDPLRQLFTGIQVAGPRLDPATIDRGFHAIPRVASTDPAIPACFYEPADYTCVKDAVAMWWTTGPDGQGCWRMAAKGRRFLSDSWPEGDVLNMKSATDPCSLHRANQ